MKAVLAVLLVISTGTWGFAQTKTDAKLPDRVVSVLGVKSDAGLGSPEYDTALLGHLQSLGAMKDVFGYVCARAEADDLIVCAQWYARSLHVWFGAYEGGERVECDIDIWFGRRGNVSEVTTWVGRKPAEAQPETVRPFFSRVKPPPESVLEKQPNQPPQRNAGSRPSSGDSPVSETSSSLGPRG